LDDFDDTLSLLEIFLETIEPFASGFICACFAGGDGNIRQSAGQFL
jgi:hypothetical protein